MLSSSSFSSFVTETPFGIRPTFDTSTVVNNVNIVSIHIMSNASMCIQVAMYVFVN